MRRPTMLGNSLPEQYRVCYATSLGGQCRRPPIFFLFRVQRRRVLRTGGGRTLMDQPDSAETARLLAQARAGHADAVAGLLDRHRPYLHRVIDLRLDARVRGRVDPSDVVQETQLEATRRLDEYLTRQPMPFRLWLRKLACDNLVEARRRHLGAARRSVERELALPERSSLL